MLEGSAVVQEPFERPGTDARERYGALISLIEELEAVARYEQRIGATSDDGLARILARSRDEEMEHAAMSLEWLRRRIPRLDEALRRHLFIGGDIARPEPGARSVAGTVAAASARSDDAWSNGARSDDARPDDLRSDASRSDASRSDGWSGAYEVVVDPDGAAADGSLGVSAPRRRTRVAASSGRVLAATSPAAAAASARARGMS